MAQEFSYPTAAQVFRIAAELETATMADLDEFKMFPTVNRDTHNVRWWQQDNPYGRMHFRGLEGRPAKVQRLGDGSFAYEPGVYGEFISIGERELTTRAIPNRPDIVVPIDDLVTNAEKQMVGREITRMRYNIWQMLGTGTLSVSLPGPTGPVIWSDTYNIQTYTSTIPWSTLATATPIRDMQTVQQLSVGHGVDFGAGATLYVNQVTANRLINNANASDFGGRRNQAGSTLNNLASFNSYFAGQNLPQIKIIEDGFQPFPIAGPETNPVAQYVKFIPDGLAILVGKRPAGQTVGEWQRTLNLNNPGGASGPYQYVKDYIKGYNAPKETPPRIEVHRGFNGGLAIYFAAAVVAWTVG